MFTNLYAQLPSELQSLFATLAAGLNTEPTTLFTICIAVIVYFVLIFLLKMMHRSVISRRKDTLESYTLAVDDLIYTMQKMVSDGLAEVDTIAWIANRDPATSYIKAHEEIQKNAQLV